MAKPKVRLKVREAEVVKALKDWAKLHPEVQLYRFHVGGVPTGKGSYRPHEHKGAADFFLQIFYMGMPLIAFYECKGSDGKLSDSQEAFRESVTAAGGYYFIIQSIQDAEDALESIKQETRRKVPTGFGGHSERSSQPAGTGNTQRNILGSNADRLLDAQVRVAQSS